MKEEIWRAFCADLAVGLVPAGLAVSTGFTSITGDPLMLYITGPDQNGLWRIQDDGSTMPFVEATGADLQVGARAESFRSLLNEFAASYDEDTYEIVSIPVARPEVPKAALRFMALLLRVQDLTLLTKEKVLDTWVQEATRDLARDLEGRAIIEPDRAISALLSEYPADIAIHAAGRPPVAVFFGTSDVKAYEALLLHSTAKYQRALACSVVLLIEKDSGLSKRARIRADNNLIVPRYRGGERDAIGRIVEEATGQRPTVMMH